MVVASTIRVFLELTPFTPESWPLSKELAKRVGEKNVLEFHRIGLYICLGQIILWAPELLFSKSY